jgi:hypothetical protein
LIQSKSGELHFIPADEPHEYDGDCWCLPEWEQWIERLQSGAFWHNPQHAPDAD